MTANLLLKVRGRYLHFDTTFPMTGGGEDVDICIQARRRGGPVVALPSTRVEHPWWGGGSWTAIATQLVRYLVATKYLRYHVACQRQKSTSTPVPRAFGALAINCCCCVRSAAYTWQPLQFKWTQGDSLLLEKHPEHRFRTPPNLVEHMLALALLLPFVPKACFLVHALSLADIIAGTAWVYVQNTHMGRARGMLLHQVREPELLLGLWHR